MGKLGRSVSIIGVGYTPLGNVLTTPELQGLSERELFSWAAMMAMEDAGVGPKDIDALNVGLVAGDNWSKTMSAGPSFAKWAGMKNKPVIYHEEGCGTSIIGLWQAVQGVASGMYDCMLTVGTNVNLSWPKVGKPPYIRDAYDPLQQWQHILSANDATYGLLGGDTIDRGIEAAVNRYCRMYGIPFEDIDVAATEYMINQRNTALKNPKACLVSESFEDEASAFGFENPRDYLMSDIFNPRIGRIMRARNAGAMVDGAAAIIVCETEKAKQICKNMPIEIAGINAATYMSVDFGFSAYEDLKALCDKTYDEAGIEDPYEQVQYLSVHDCPVYTLLFAGEAAGYFKPGEAWKAMRDGETLFTGSRPINTTGGRTQTGHPVAGATNVEVCEAVAQMRGQNGARQMPTPPKVAGIYGYGLGISAGFTVLKAL